MPALKKITGRSFAILVLCLSFVTLLHAQATRNLLTSATSLEQLSAMVDTGTGWVNFPAYTNRQKWYEISPVYKTLWVKEGEGLMNYQWQVVPASSYLEFVRTGNRDTMQEVYGQNTSALRKLVLAELVEGKGRFMPQIVNGVWALCEMTTWSLSAHLYMQKAGIGLPDVNDPIIDLGVGMTGAMLAWTHYFFKESFDKINPLISKRIEYEINRQILQPYYNRSDLWWMALGEKAGQVNNWNVWVNYNSLTCILLIEKDPQKKLAGIYKSMRSVDKFINYYKDDGGCEEGPAYWSHAGGMLFNYLELLMHCTRGSINKFDDPLVRNIGSYIYKAYINDRYYINYADAAAQLSPDAGLIYAYGKSTGDTLLKDFGSYLASQQNWKEQVPTGTVEAALENAFLAKEVLAGNSNKPLLKEFWLPGTQIMGARDKEGTTDGFYFSALGGHNGESHNHNDVGTCILFYNGQPVLIDVGSGTYTRQTFGPERYTIWTMQSAYHNVPLVNGIQQKEGASFAARNPVFRSDKTFAEFSLDIAGAYPSEAKLQSWIRKYRLERGKSFEIRDQYKLSENNGGNELHFITSNKVDKIKDGILRFTMENGKLDLAYNPSALTPVIESIKVEDKRLLQSWPSTLYRIVFKITSTKLSNETKLVFTSTK